MYFLSDLLVNFLVFNLIYSVVFVIKNMGNEKNVSSLYGIMLCDEIL